MNFFKTLRITKRQQFITVVALLTIAMISTHLFFADLQLTAMLLLAAFATILSAIVLREDLRGWEFVTLLTLPAYFTAAVFLFYFLLPARWLTRLPIALLYALGMYTILLTENIYNVAAERTIQLLRAAHSVGFLLTLLTHFFLLDTLLSLKLPFHLNILGEFLIVFPLTFQALWSMELTTYISKKVLLSTLVISTILTQLVFVFSFWPIKTTIEALLLTTVLYSLVGMTQQYLIERLFPKTTREFLSWLVIAFVLMLLTVRWS